MGYTISDLKDKLLEFHPEIAQSGVNLLVTFDEKQKRYLLTLSQAGQELTAYLEKQDADDCLNGKKCVTLAVQLTQLIAEFADLLTPRKPW
jgi:hypothetical protein